ncbi:MAG TPA: class A beta-lactamase-related serine hydrolase [Devosia sp.]|nr:class A beta-lactamase-related serine hydrolase [Devosia sp.]
MPTTSSTTQDTDNRFVAGIISRARRKFNIPAIVVTVMNSNALQTVQMDGVRQFDTDEAITLNDLFHIGSCSKSVLAVIAGRLVEQGKLNWETRFFEVFPEMEAQADKDYAEITLEDLFLCEAGIKPYTSGGEEFPEIDPGAPSRRDAFIKFLLQLPPAAQKKSNGTFVHLYSNASYTLASAMIEKVLDTDYAGIVEHLAKELNLKIAMGWPNKHGADQPWGHMIGNDKIIKFRPNHEYALPDLIAPAGDLSMSPPDFSEYIRQHLAGLTGQGGYLTPATIKKIHFGYKGFCLGVTNGVLEGVSYSVINGSAGTFYCQAILAPKADFALTITMNAGSGSARMEAVEWLTVRLLKHRFNWWWKFWM